jgi:hypothetical protein
MQINQNVVVGLDQQFNAGYDNVTINGNLTLVEAAPDGTAVSGKLRIAMRLYTNSTTNNSTFGYVRVNGFVSLPFNSTLVMGFEDGNAGTTFRPSRPQTA